MGDINISGNFEYFMNWIVFFMPNSIPQPCLTCRLHRKGAVTVHHMIFIADIYFAFLGISVQSTWI